ncbi:MAG: NTP transferase domain-containing protein [Phycisphaerales bacterium]|nr:MAG: NTP transferase domain-containing protein [Phycisphaerales bacterium]
MDEVVVAVLASGRGTRMGGPKILMRVGGQVWWRVQRRRLAGLGDRVRLIWIVSGIVEEALSGEADAPGPRVLGDDSAPMFESVRLAAKSVHESGESVGMFVLPVDVPVPSSGVFETLEETSRESGRSVPTRPQFENKTGHPVFLPAEWIAKIARMDEHEVRSRATTESMRLDRLIEGEVMSVEVEDAGVLVNLNTPEDVAAWVASATD